MRYSAYVTLRAYSACFYLDLDIEKLNMYLNPLLMLDSMVCITINQLYFCLVSCGSVVAEAYVRCFLFHGRCGQKDPRKPLWRAWRILDVRRAVRSLATRGCSDERTECKLRSSTRLWGQRLGQPREIIGKRRKGFIQ